jgi:hypothetical protein
MELDGVVNHFDQMISVMLAANGENQSSARHRGKW